MGEKKTNALSKSMKLIYVYAMATGAIFTFMCYWDGIFMSYTGPGTFLAFALMTLAVLPTAFVYAEFSTMLPSTGSCLVFNTVGINKHAGCLLYTSTKPLGFICEKICIIKPYGLFFALR